MRRLSGSERGCIIKPLQKEETPDDRVKRLEEQGILRKAVKGRLPVHRPIAIHGKPLSETVIEGREDRF